MIGFMLWSDIHFEVNIEYLCKSGKKQLYDKNN